MGGYKVIIIGSGMWFCLTVTVYVIQIADEGTMAEEMLD